MNRAECEVKVMKSIFGYSEEEVDAVLEKVSGILEKELSDTDYIIIKQQESAIIGDEMPYTLEQMIEIANLRAAKRKRINELEKKINER